MVPLQVRRWHFSVTASFSVRVQHWWIIITIIIPTEQNSNALFSFHSSLLAAFLYLQPTPPAFRGFDLAFIILRRRQLIARRWQCCGLTANDVYYNVLCKTDWAKTIISLAQTCVVGRTALVYIHCLRVHTRATSRYLHTHKPLLIFFKFTLPSYVGPVRRRATSSPSSALAALWFSWLSLWLILNLLVETMISSSPDNFDKYN